MALPKNGIDRNNVISIFLMGALPAVGGSVISVMLYSFFVWGVLSLALQRFEFEMTRSDRVLAVTFTAFAASIVLTALIGPNRSDIPHSIIWLLAFLAPWVVIPRLRATKGIDLLSPYLIGAAVGAVIAAFLALIQSGLSGVRSEGGAGNAAVFSIMSLCLMGIGGLNIASASRARQLLAIAAVVGGTVALVMSLTRGVAIALLPVLFLLFLFDPARWRSVVVRPISLAILTAATIAFYSFQRMLDWRWEQTVREFHRILMGQQTTKSIGERLRLWEAGRDAFLESPFWGHGIQNRMASLVPELSKDDLPIRSFTHAHNGFLSFALDGGILTLTALIAVLCAPVFIAWRAPRDANYRMRLFLALIVSTTYAVSGMTQIMFKHDIMDAFFVFCAILIAASIPAGSGSDAIRANAKPPAS
jgi:O-antigen ligase